MNTDYGPDNPEPLGMKDSSVVRDPSKDALHAAMEYILGNPSPGTEEQPAAKPGGEE
jgi:hypothetical protein